MSTDDLLDEATRLAGDYRNLDEGRTLRALVERVQQAEADVRWITDCFTSANESCQAESRAKWEAMAERDAALGKLDKVRRLIPTENPELIEAGYGIDSGDVLAILDE